MPKEPAANVPVRDLTIQTDLYTAVLSTLGGRIQSFQLKKFRATNAPDSPPLELIVPGEEAQLPMGFELRGASVWSDAKAAYDTTSPEELVLTGDAKATVDLRTTVAGQPLVKHLVFTGNSYVLELAVDAPGATGLPKELLAPAPDGQPSGMALVWSKTLSRERQAGGVFEGAAAFIGGKLVQTPASKIEKPENLDGPVTWAGYEDHYFLSAVAPDRSNLIALRPAGSAVETKVITARSGSDPQHLSYALFLGPKELSILDAAGHDFSRSLNLGWFGPISLLLLRVLNLSHRVTGNYGIDIIVLTLLVKVAFWPLTKKSFQSMREMQKLQPEMTKLREKYKDDPKQMNSEIMELYRRHKVNPLGGCVPMVLQIPVFFGLYQALSSTIQLRHAPFFLWIHDLSAPERLPILGYGVPVLTILLGLSMFLQQRMSPPAGDPTQQKVMMFMPLVFTYMFIGFPAGLTIYWLTNNLLTIAQQYFVLRRLPT